MANITTTQQIIHSQYFCTLCKETCCYNITKKKIYIDGRNTSFSILRDVTPLHMSETALFFKVKQEMEVATVFSSL